MFIQMMWKHNSWRLSNLMKDALAILSLRGVETHCVESRGSPHRHAGEPPIRAGPYWPNRSREYSRPISIAHGASNSRATVFRLAAEREWNSSFSVFVSPGCENIRNDHALSKCVNIPPASYENTKRERASL